MAAKKGQFVWFDLITTDPDKARAFYTELFNWNVIMFDMSVAGGQGEFPMVAVGETPFGGITKLPGSMASAGVPSHWMAYANVDDVDATVAQVKELGGSVKQKPMDIPTIGRMAVITDPQGAALALFKGVNEMEGHSGEQGEFCWHELMSSDHEAALDFYSQVLGFSRGEAMDMGPAGTYQMYDIGEQTVGGMMTIPKTDEYANVPPHWVHYTVVEDVEATKARAEQLGAQILHGPVDVPGGRIVMAKDPTGAVFAFWSGQAQS